jgi:hypothetical protein
MLKLYHRIPPAHSKEQSGNSLEEDQTKDFMNHEKTYKRTSSAYAFKFLTITLQRSSDAAF